MSRLRVLLVVQISLSFATLGYAASQDAAISAVIQKSAVEPPTETATSTPTPAATVRHRSALRTAPCRR